MSSNDCKHCGEPIPRGARACGNCGAPVRARSRGLAIVAAVAVLCLASITLAMFLLGHRTPNQDATGVAPRDGDFVWLETAMKQCDEQAAKEPKGLHYLVIPLVDEPRDEPGWRRVSINDIGNAILINSEDMLAGLRRRD